MGFSRIFVKQYYLGRELPKNVKPQFDNCLVYFSSFANFAEYVDKNYLNPFVNDDYEIKDIFSNPKDYKVGTVCLNTYHEYGDPFPEGRKRDKDGRRHAMNYIENSLWIWQQRALLF